MAERTTIRGGQEPSVPNWPVEAVFQDRLGTNRASGARFRPYGDEITSTANDREKFGTYNRDGFTGLDYADQRYYASSLGRFNTADAVPNSRSADPVSWNKYAYVGGDPIQRTDRHGTCWEEGGDYCEPSRPVDGSQWGRGSERDTWDYPEQNKPFELPFRAMTSEEFLPLLQRALADAKNLLNNKDSTCRDVLFGPGRDPAEVLDSLAAGDFKYGSSIAFGAVNPGSTAETQCSGTNCTVRLNINAFGEFSGESPLERAQTLIHELGHVFYRVFGENSTTILPDNSNGDPGYIAGAINRQAIKENCK